ncbi:unnamed protein product [Paramecium primaurelia]|uniref:Uncharacterized protein n=1 Tax=Paramecium primaurelia TaxID=5886 RepID=A0A8S1Q1X3_PARPR|nr:unnamed protein product [Paramecium primaurelia]
MYRGQSMSNYQCIFQIVVAVGLMNVNQKEIQKIGSWIELSIRSNDDSQITYVDEYFFGKNFVNEIFTQVLSFLMDKQTDVNIQQISVMKNYMMKIVKGISFKVNQWIEQSEGFQEISRLQSKDLQKWQEV